MMYVFIVQTNNEAQVHTQAVRERTCSKNSEVSIRSGPGTVVERRVTRVLIDSPLHSRWRHDHVSAPQACNPSCPPLFTPCPSHNYTVCGTWGCPCGERNPRPWRHAAPACPSWHSYTTAAQPLIHLHKVDSGIANGTHHTLLSVCQAMCTHPTHPGMDTRSTLGSEGSQVMRCNRSTDDP